MAQFEVPVVRVDRIEEHPGADALEIAVVRGYRCVVKIGAHRAGDLVAYIPEDAIVPEPLIREMRLWDEAKGKGMLAGKKGDRVKAIRLRGIVSQGLLYPVEGREEGQRVLAEAREAAERYREQQATQARAEAAQLIDRAREEIRQERDAALEQVRSEFAGLAVSAAERIIHRSLDPDAHRDLIDEVLAEGDARAGRN